MPELSEIVPSGVMVERWPVVWKQEWPNQYLVGGWATPLKNMKVNWDDHSQYMGK